VANAAARSVRRLASPPIATTQLAAVSAPRTTASISIPRTANTMVSGVPTTTNTIAHAIASVLE
jgi:hypothetical protein